MVKRYSWIIGMIAVVIVSTNVQAQSRFALSSTSISVTEPIAGVVTGGRYAINSGFAATQSSATQAYRIYLPHIDN